MCYNDRIKMRSEADDMALTMVHLLVADLWAQGHPEYRVSPEFYLGAVSPDAVHIRDHNDKSHKDEIHLYNWRRLHREPLLDYWHKRSAPFDIGYGVHVLTDCQWVSRYVQRLPGIMLPTGLLNIDIYYNDTFVTDFALYNSRPRLREVLSMLEDAQAPWDHPLLTHYEFDEWRKAMLAAYRGKCPKSVPVKFIDEAYVADFAADSIPLIEEMYKEAFPD